DIRPNGLDAETAAVDPRRALPAPGVAATSGAATPGAATPGAAQPGAGSAAPAPLAAARPAANSPGSSAALVPVLDRAFWLQLGAFGSPGNAHAARERLLRQMTGLGAPLDVVADSGLYKLQAGPWPTREAALAAGERVRATTGLQPFAMER
ncbi:MAG: SPOR domain-containing protein, partial [Gammaproteobacteria bacterium]